MFHDEAEIEIRAGDGGDGVVSFRREKYVPRGGPDGGDGGKGGDVVFLCDHSLNTLNDLAHTPTLSAGNGKPGRGRNCHGANGEDLVIKVPVGTIVHDAATGSRLADLTEAESRVVVARGGKGGRGNKHFATATHQVPREAEDGRPGDHRRLRLELKIIADVGLVGLPNAGKSTLLSRVSAARPKIAAYKFTTIQPHLGIVQVGEFRRLVFADIPGLIEGAHEGHGLGDRFLRHIERTRIVIHLVDVSPFADESPANAYLTVRRELARYSGELAAKPEVVVANKVDIPESEEGLAALTEAAGCAPVRISAYRGDGLTDLIRAVVEMLDAVPAHREGTL